ncbi:5-methyltetrahydropteroyltriglutamate--homocysteine S-methyltransferase [soil metagenome]
MAISTISGYPRIGKHRELKRALGGFWSGKRSADELETVAATLRSENRAVQRAAGIELIPVNDFSFYDLVLDTIALVGAAPARYAWSEGDISNDVYFAMARGRANERPVAALDMTKWFDTNYHFLVPELEPNQTFRLASEKPFTELAEAIVDGVQAKVTLVGPVTFLLLSRSAGGDLDRAALLERLLPVYEEVVSRLATQGAAWIQFDESAFVLDRTDDQIALLNVAYERLSAVKGSAKLAIHTAHGHVGSAYRTLVGLPVDAIGFDFVRGKRNLSLIEEHGFPTDKALVAGVVDGRNIWVNDLGTTLDLIERLTGSVDRDRLQISSSTSLLHTPYDVRLETELNPELLPWLAFAEQKLTEITLITKAVNEGRTAIANELAENTRILNLRANSRLRSNTAVQARLAAGAEATDRQSPFASRKKLQETRLNLPLLPTTTIGSFPQTNEVRIARHAFETGETDLAGYERFVEDRTRDVIRLQEEIGLDVLVHGEYERNDMVQYFGEQLNGFAFTHLGWVQSYGSRCVRPPVIYGDVDRPQAMTVRWAKYAQSLTKRPVKGMLTGPVTILNWSFVRDDQPRETTCRQIAFAIKDEVRDLDEAGIAIIQVDEPALREGLPLRHEEWAEYLDWAVASFRISASGARDETQVHTHMCYSDFGDIIDAISALDADVISIENARSDNELLRVFRSHGYDKEIGPGVFDIHSPRVPDADEMADNIRATLDVLGLGQVWVNPDCGLKTRKTQEAHDQLVNMVEAATRVRAELAKTLA